MIILQPWQNFWMCSGNIAIKYPFMFWLYIYFHTKSHWKKCLTAVTWLHYVDALMSSWTHTVVYNGLCKPGYQQIVVDYEMANMMQLHDHCCSLCTCASIICYECCTRQALMVTHIVISQWHFVGWCWLGCLAKVFVQLPSLHNSTERLYI